MSFHSPTSFIIEPIKQGTRVTNIRLLDHPVDGHDIECTIDGFGRMYLKSELVKKI